MNLRNGQITVREILANPQARMLLKREFPALMQSPMLRMAGGMTLSQVLARAGRHLSQETAERVLAELRAL